MKRNSQFLFIIITIIFFTFSKKEAKSSLSDNEKKQVVFEHNKWRHDVNVDSLQWSDKLASEAQIWANYLAKRGCRMKHSKTPNGENIYWSTFESTVENVVDSWAEEKKYYHGGKLKSSKITKYGHYTQIVWYSTKLVGCGKAKCKNGHEIWVCTYYPAGNYIGEKPY